jgi:peptide/nickel transport system permease protein
MHDNPSRWSRFRRNPLAMGGVIFIACCVLVVLAGPFIRPDDTVHANHQQLVLSRMKPMSEVFVVRVPRQHEPGTWWKKWTDGGAEHAYDEVPVTKLDDESLFFVVAPIDQADTIRFSSVAVRTDSGWRVSPEYLHQRTFVLGTDKYGRDVLSRLMAGTAVSLSVGAIAVLISLLVGLTLGLLAGYYRGWVDALIMWFTNVVWAVPTLLLVMAITFAFGTGFWKVFLAVGLTMWVEVARITRGQVLSVREKEYVEAARAIGLPDRRIIFRHILPNILSPIIVISAANFASAILIEAGLSFLGLGAQIPTPSWGNMIREHYAYLTTDLAYLAIVPGIMIMLLVLSFMMIGNGLRDALDVRR